MEKTENKAVLNKLSKRHTKSNKMRNIFVVVAIILTTVLFTSLFTIAASLLKSAEESSMRQVGGSEHGGYSYLTREEYEVLREHKYIEEYGTTILVGLAENEELAKRQVEICYMDGNEAKYRFVTPLVEGNMPKEEDEIVLDTITLDLLGLEREVGQKLTLNYRILDGEYSKEFILSGYYQGDIVAMASMACVSEKFIDENISHIDQKESRDKGIYTGTIGLSVMFSKEYDIEEKLTEILLDNNFKVEDFSYGANWAYMKNKFSSIDLSSILATIGLISIVFICGYLIIYNIFYLSIVKDIKFYGLLKTIGTTTDQIKKIVTKQAMILSSIGIPLGLGLGYGIGIILLPYVMNNLSVEYTKVSASPMIFIGSVIFSLITILISCKKPAKLASRVSPIEAIRYTGLDGNIRKEMKKGSDGGKIHKMAFSNILRDKKKGILVIISLSIAIILLNSIYTMVAGFDLDEFLSGEYATDFTIGDASFYRWNFDESKGSALTEELCGEIENLEGVEKVGRIYNKNLLKAITNEEKKLLIENIDELGMETGYDGNLAYGYMVITEKNQVDLNLYGMSDVLFPLLKPYVIEGDIDLDLFRTGDYIISTRKHNNIDIYKVGDKVTLSSDDGHSKEYSVMAVVENLPLYLYIGRDSDFSLSMYMPSEELEKIAGKLPIMVGMFDVEEDNISSVDAYIKDKTKEIPGLDYRSKEKFVKEFNDMVNTYNTVGYSLSLIIGLIGVLNFANVIITSIISRRKEFATMQSIGLTSK